MVKNYLAFDFGASGGRAIVGSYDGEAIKLTEVHRFPNNLLEVDGGYFWDINQLKKELFTGLRLAGEQFLIESVGVDTWGVDFGLLDADGELLSLPYHYRHSHTQNTLDKLNKIIPLKEIFLQTGTAMQPYNTLCQLYEINNNTDLLKKAKKLLFMPDLFAYFLTGDTETEFSIASTSMMLQKATQKWNYDLLNKLKIPTDFLPNIGKTGRNRGALKKELVTNANLAHTKVIAVAGHDTASAVMAVSDSHSAYISSGTWSLLGINLDAPVLTEEAFQNGYTNEGAYDGKIRFINNIMGLWIIQECRREWLAECPNLSYIDIENLAANAQDINAIINPDDKIFYAPGDMPNKVVQYCKSNCAEAPKSIGEISRVVFRGLANKYAIALNAMQQITNQNCEKLTIVGGGSKNELLNAFTAEATGKNVVTGEKEATALGNILCQIKNCN